MRDIILIVALLVIVPMSLFRPYFGVLAWFWISYFNPQQFTWGPARAVQAAYLIAVATVVGALLSRKWRMPSLTKETVLMLSLWLWFVITTIAVYGSPTFQHHFDATIYLFSRTSKILFMTFVSIALVTNRGRLRWLYLTTASIFAFFAFKAVVFAAMTGGQYRVYGPPGSMIGDNNDFALAMNMALPMFVCMAKIEKSRRLQLLFRVSVLAGVLAIVFTFSRGGLVALVAVIMALALRSTRKVVSLIAAGVLAIGTLAVVPQAWVERMSTISDAAETDSSAQGRLVAWRLATNIALDSPTGGGFNTWTREVYDTYGVRSTALVAHSIYFQMLGEHGFIGLGLFLLLLGSCFYSCWRLRSRYCEYSQAGWIATYADMVSISLLAFIFGGAFASRAYFDLFYQLVATVVILKYMAHQYDQEESLQTTRGGAFTDILMVHDDELGAQV